MFVKELTNNPKLNATHSGIYLTKGSPVFSCIQQWYLDMLSKGNKPSKPVSNLLSCGILIGFNENDFINPSCYKGAVSLYKCKGNSPKLTKKYFYEKIGSKKIGLVYMLGFKMTDYDGSMNYLLVDKIEFLHILQSKMIEEFPAYPTKLYDPNHVYDRDWEHIKGISPSEKIYLANIHNEEAFPLSFYENDRGTFANRTQSDEYAIRLEGEINVDVRDYDIRDYENDGFSNTFEVAENIMLAREESFNEARDGFDYGDYQEFSDIYTRTQTSYEDYELYPVRVNCLPKAIKKKGKSPYDTTLGVRSYIWHNMWAKPEKLEDKKWVCNPMSAPSPDPVKYDWQMSEDEKLADEYNLPENFWEEIEMAYQQR